MLAIRTPPMGLVAHSEHHSVMLVVGTGLVALVLCIVAPILGHSLTMAHEGGHATIAALLGGSVVGLVLERDRSGHTLAAGLGWFGLIGYWLAGYLAPSLFGLLGALLLAADEVPAALFATLVLLALLFVITRGIFGRLIVLVAIGFFYLVVRYGSDAAQLAVAFTWVWFLLIGGFAEAVKASALHRQARQLGHKGAGDAKYLRDHTFLPAAFWVAIFVSGTFVTMVYGASILLGGGGSS